MELNAYKNELMTYKDKVAIEQKFVVLKIGTLKNLLVSIQFKKEKKEYLIIMESKTTEWQIPFSTVICLLKDEAKERTLIVYQEKKVKQAIFETFDHEAIIETYKNLCLLLNQSPVVLSIEEYNQQQKDGSESLKKLLPFIGGKQKITEQEESEEEEDSTWLKYQSEIEESRLLEL